MYQYKTNEIKLRNLTNDECRYLLTEKLHRAEFLDAIKNDISQFVERNITEMISQGETERTVDFVTPNDWFEKLVVKINFIIGDIKRSFKKYGAKYFNKSPIDNNGKLASPQLYVTMVVDENGETMLPLIKPFVDHEITHLYDDWQWLNNGHEESLCNQPKAVDSSVIDEYAKTINSKLLETIGFGCYLSSYTEENSYVSQTVSELWTLGAKRSNISKKLKATVAYRNYTKFKNDLKYFIENSSFMDLANTNFILYKYFKNSGIPSMPPNVFDANLFVNKLLKWAKMIRVHFLKRYCGIVQYYLDERYANKSII